MNTPQIIDLYAGAGGLSLGAARAGFNVAAAVEIDKFALETHKKNFPKTEHIDTSVADLTGEALLQLAKLKPGELSGLIGGPPCQGFSSMGKGDVTDDRNTLFGHFFRLVSETSPAFYVAENVPNILNEKYDQIRADAFAQLDKKYTQLKPIKIKANDYGAPTIRTRIFFIGYDANKISKISEEMFLPPSDIKKITVKTALAGLPQEIDSEWQSEESGWRPYTPMIRSVFSKCITGNIPEGVGDPKTIERYKKDKLVSGCMGTRHTPDLIARYSALEEGKQDSTSKATRLKADGFCPTLRAGTGSDKGSYQAVRPIHYAEPRVITPREAARLQGFPDWFALHRTKWHSFRQIGNSVSPIVSQAIMSVIARLLNA